MDLDRLADVLIGYSAAVRTGEVVSLHGPTTAERLLVALYCAVLRAGGHPVLLLQSPACEELLLQYGTPQQLTFVDPLAAREVELADVALHVLGAPPSLATIEPERLAFYQQARLPLLERFFARSAARTLRWTATLFPEAHMAQAAGLSLVQLEELFLRAAFLDQPEPCAAWRRQAQAQAHLIAGLQGVRELRFVTPAGTDLRVGIAGRAWTNGAGQNNFPDGEICLAPLEGATEGSLVCDVPIQHGGRRLRDLRLVFRAGRVTEASASEGADYLRALLAQDAGASVLGEVALGCNYAIDRPTGQPLLDEKIGGTFHVALGTSLPGSGGQNRSALHWDMIADLRHGGRLEADGRLISENGRFVDPTWPHQVSVP